LLRYKANDKYPFLEKFLNDICNFNVTIENPTVKNVDSCGRIDIPIFDKKYVVVIENKVTDKAPDQNNQKGGQLARYIETINNTYNRKLEDIFVVYTPKYTREPPNECWTNKDDFSYKDDFKLRFRSLSYRDSIYPWFKNEILPIIGVKDIYLRSAVEQYIDHLEGMFWLRTIDKKMNMKLQEFIKGKLEINEVEPEIALKIVSEKRQEMANVLAQLDLLQEEIQTEIDVKYFSETYNKLKELDYIVVRKIDSYPDYLPKSVGVKLANKLTIWLGKDDGIESELFCQVNSNDNDKKLPLKVKQKFEEIFRDENIGTDKNGFQIWAYIENYDNALIYLKEFCEKMSEI
ncbi:MAG TPA: PD-(D/E)XK nuclease family protein, partial [Paludibacter sp.]|nr:PD-(D/E)XK nuclease family protein [Paludibacter sp.]